MYLFISIILSAILGYILLMLGPILGGVLTFGIVVGCLFRGLFLLSEIHKSIKIKDKVQIGFEKYLEERDRDKDK
ncbi:hypothetical protein [Virgibacillus ndiopensis]|uniref:hypothetical protein n=1 Tax=Virgibacillus ndiopensis TaxID=2004408 RepID=UPI000C069A8D|nr:hypothetical protein [Virgibacillus ndiopensis]